MPYDKELVIMTVKQLGSLISRRQQVVMGKHTIDPRYNSTNFQQIQETAGKHAIDPMGNGTNMKQIKERVGQTFNAIP